MVANPDADGFIKLGSLLFEGQQLLRQGVHQPGGPLLLRQAGVLMFDGMDNHLGQPVGADDVAVRNQVTSRPLSIWRSATGADRRSAKRAGLYWSDPTPAPDRG
ncbi:hypothetical protein [Streptomyces sp. NBC_00258]|uniref:hypothetical protein n=1 Tax=Streptomyces sp. NBC_00258 TaxID=2903642 RepID=UPI002E2896F9|nr:hypothetical protein [Streptomyces sp. NBC_00258]